MKILICTPEYYPNGSGIANVAYNVAEQLKKKGVECIICSPTGPDIEIKCLEGCGRLSLIHFWYNVDKYFKDKDNNYDAVWLHYPLFIGNVPFKKCLITVHSTAYGFMNENISPKFYYRLSYLLEKFCLNKFRKKVRFTGVSNRTCKELESILVHGQAVKLIFNGADTSIFKPVTSKNFSRKKFNIPQNSKVILSVGRLVDHKMPFLMLDVFHQLQEKTSNKYALVVAGKGKLFEPLKEYSITHNIDNVQFLGYVSDNDLPDLYSCSDYFIITSNYEGGEPVLTVAEAMASGLPCIASNIPNLKIVEFSNAGILIDFSDPKKATEDIFNYVSKESPRHSINAREFAVQNLNWSIIAEKYLDELKTLQP
jgi:1,2-diacylglycerol 3-alpha-glucosyltransferase